MTKDYPRWSCWECGVKHGTKKDRIASWHFGKCDVCELNNNVTEPRDFGHFANWFTAKGKKSYELQSSDGKTYFLLREEKSIPKLSLLASNYFHSLTHFIHSAG